MSGVRSNYITPNIFEGLLYGAQKDSPNLEQGLNAVFKGETSSHAGGKIYFNQDMFDKYIQGTPTRKEIPYEKYNTENGTVYAVDINFGPTSGKIASPGSRLSLATESQLASQALSRREHSEFALKNDLVDKRYIQSPLPILSWFSRREISVSATTIIHSSMIPQDILKNFKGSDAEKLKSVETELKNFALTVEKLEQEYFTNKTATAFEAYINNFYNAIDALQKKLYPLDPKMSRIEFMQNLDKFTSFGLSPEKSSINLVTDEQQNGYSIERMLQFLRTNFDDAEHNPYNLFIHNCSHFLNEMFLYAATGPNVADLKKPFVITPEYKALGAVAEILPFPRPLASPNDGICTPAMFFKQLEVAKNTVPKLQKITPLQKQEPSPQHGYNRKHLFASFNLHSNSASKRKDFEPVIKVLVQNINLDISNVATKVEENHANLNSTDNLYIEQKGNVCNFFINGSHAATITKNDENASLSIQYTDMPPNNKTTPEISKTIFAAIYPKKNEKVVLNIEGEDSANTTSLAELINASLTPKINAIPINILINQQEYNTSTNTKDSFDYR